MLEIGITHKGKAGYGIDVISDRAVRWNQSLTWVKSHNEVLEIVEEILNDYRRG